ncbi:MAG: type IV secretory system conjugative DNA transfer family protein [Proteobacteria bacterium]|nr:type IV secretory system conjugative DNA transfer family protein [Pseudomonadota bacterium]
MWVSRVLLFALLMFGLYAPLQNVFFSKSSGGGGHRWRRLKGFLLDLMVVGVVWGLPVAALYARDWDVPSIVIPIWGLSLGLFMWCRWLVYGWFAEITAPVRKWLRSRKFGAGGSAAFGGVFEDFAARFRRGGVLLGSSLYFSSGRQKMFKVGVHDDRHVLTIASTRSGKGRSAIIPNLILWPHSALVIDPKGTNAAVTAPRRGRHREGSRVTKCLGQDVFVVDPFEIVEGVERSSCQSALNFDPLSASNIDPSCGREEVVPVVNRGAPRGFV